jgi:restriction system protein
MSRYWHRYKRYGREKPENLIFFLIAIFVFAIYYPPMRTAILQLWFIYFFAILGLAIWFIYRIYQHHLLSRAGMLEIDKMTGEQFEERLKILFANLGYEAERTSPGKVKPDYGVDLVVKKDGIKTAIQAKCYREQLVGEDAVREALAGKNWYYCNKARVITNGNYSKMAWRLARVNNVELWNRNYLLKVLLTEKSLQTKAPII